MKLSYELLFRSLSISPNLYLTIILISVTFLLTLQKTNGLPRSVTLVSIINIDYQNMDISEKEKQTETLYSDEDLFVLMSYRTENEMEAQKAFRIFYDRYKNLLWSLCYSVCKKLNIDNWEELVKVIFNNTMIAVFESPTYDSSKSKLSTWMSKIAYNETLDLINESKISTGKTIPLNEEITNSIADEENVIYYDTPQKKLLDAALNLLSERDREILLTYFMYQEENKHLPDDVLEELSLRYSTTSANIRQIKKRALDKIKAYISQNSTSNN